MVATVQRDLLPDWRELDPRQRRDRCRWVARRYRLGGAQWFLETLEASADFWATARNSDPWLERFVFWTTTDVPAGGIVGTEQEAEDSNFERWKQRKRERPSRKNQRTSRRSDKPTRPGRPLTPKAFKVFIAYHCFNVPLSKVAKKFGMTEPHASEMVERVERALGVGARPPNRAGRPRRGR